MRGLEYEVEHDARHDGNDSKESTVRISAWADWLMCRSIYCSTWDASSVLLSGIVRVYSNCGV